MIKKKHREMVKRLGPALVAEALLGKSGYTFVDLSELCETYVHKYNDYHCQIITTAHGYSVIVKNGEFDKTKIITQPEEDLEKFMEYFIKYMIY